MATSKQTQAARRNVKKAEKAADGMAAATLPAKTETALGYSAAVAQYVTD